MVHCVDYLSKTFKLATKSHSVQEDCYCQCQYHSAVSHFWILNRRIVEKDASKSKNQDKQFHIPLFCFAIDFIKNFVITALHFSFCTSP